MKNEAEITGFEISVSGRDDGTVEAAYVRFRSGRVARTREIQQDGLLADYDRNGRLIGLEILAPVKMSKLASLVDRPMRASFKRFIEQSTTYNNLIAA